MPRFCERRHTPCRAPRWAGPVGAALFVAQAAGLGCVAPGKDADLTPIYQPLHSGGSEASFPARLIDPGAPDGSTITIRASENKDVHVEKRSWWENGQPREDLVITGDRSGVIAATSSGLGSVEGARIDARLEQLSRTLEFLDRRFEQALSALSVFTAWQQQQQQSGAAGAAGGGNARTRKALTALLATPNLPPEARALIEALLAE